MFILKESLKMSISKEISVQKSLFKKWLKMLILKEDKCSKMFYFKRKCLKMSI